MWPSPLFDRKTMASFSLSVLSLHSLSLLFLSHLSSQETLSSFSTAESPWLPSQNRTLISKSSTFSAGFIALSSVPNRYLFSVWFTSDTNRTPVWSHVPTRPVNRSASLTISAAGLISLTGGGEAGNLLPGVTKQANSSSLTLSEDGSLVFGSWSSFDYPTDTFLPNQQLNATRNLTAGKFRFADLRLLVFDYSDVYMNLTDRILNLTADGKVMQEAGSVKILADVGETRLRRLTLDRDGNLRVYSFDPGSGSWRVVWREIQEICLVHGTCGPNFVCFTNGSDDSPSCVCPAGFRILNGRCERKSPIPKDPKDSKFLQFDYVSYTGLTPAARPSLNFAKCESDCRVDGNCVAFAYKFNGQDNCFHKNDSSLVNGYWSPGLEISFFLRVDKSESDVSNFTGMMTRLDAACPVKISLPVPPDESSSARANLAVTGSLFGLELLIGILSFGTFLKRYSKYRDMARTFGLGLLPVAGPKRFSYAELKVATNDFSNIVGRGGFGVVYRGELPDHRTVAVKRLKDVARGGDAGGEADFWAEVTIIARMHHLNLVRIWGFCVEKGLRMLVYEYVPNGSLDKFLFRPSDDRPLASRPVLDLGIRYRIAIGVARAIAYLHEECLEWVLHCDIKPENILLEDDFCPKVSDFGLAKLSTKADLVSMSKIRGTRGYLAPEWINTDDGRLTPKADVYSFGMVLLEMVTGVRNFEFRMSELDSEDWYLPKWAYEKMYKEKRVEDILDRRIIDGYDSSVHLPMVDRMAKTAMWCLHDKPEMRPSMGKVAKMLEGKVEIMEPEKPTIFYLTDD